MESLKGRKVKSNRNKLFTFLCGFMSCHSVPYVRRLRLDFISQQRQVRKIHEEIPLMSGSTSAGALACSAELLSLCLDTDLG